MKKILFTVIMVFSFFITSSGEANPDCKEQFPHIAGTIKISIQRGTIEGDLEMSNLPNIAKYTIWLNAGLNIRYFRDSSDKFNYGYSRDYRREQSAEAFQYLLNDNKTDGILPQTFKINYVGAFPVISDISKASDGGDWKGNVAFNGKTLRVSEQSAWYPILYDQLNDVVYNKVTYDLKIICDDGRSIYLNGSPPASGTTANFISKTPVSLLLLAGDFDFNKNDNAYFVNTSLDNEQQTILSNLTDKVIKFYESKFKIPYGSQITYMGSTPVSKKNNWAFVTFPTFAMIGPTQLGFNTFFDEKTHQLKDPLIGFIAHELGHYYFGTYFTPNSTLFWMFLEGITEYISLQATKEIAGESNYQNNISNYIEQVKDLKVTPISDVKSANEIDNTYKYSYIPLLLTALEKEIGKEKIGKWLNILLTSKCVKTDYAFFKSTLLQSGVTEKQFIDFEANYIKSENAKQNVIANAK